MESELQKIQSEALTDIDAASGLSELEAVRVKTLGRSGSISVLSQSMKNIAKEERPRFGKLLNELREAVSSALEKRVVALNALADQALLNSLDVTLPGIQPSLGAIHPLTRLLNRATQIFHHMGFVLAEGPDIETEWHCFDALNTPANHPARNEQDTFYLSDGRLLRTHTSTIQTRVMESQSPPVRVIGPGAAYRRDEVDATHLAQFNQMEGLYVASDVSLADLKGTLSFFFRELFGPDTEIRFRPHFFPFTEPSYEIDIRTQVLGDRWMELAGCGMVDPAVFESINAARGDRTYDPDLISGFAFGFGLDRLAMNLMGIPDIRMLMENDIRFLSQFH